MQFKATFLVVLAGFCVAYAHVSRAQQAEEPEPTPQETAGTAGEEAVDASPAEAGPVEEILVTGSRIRRDEFSSASPITVITSETSALAGLLNTADILQTSTVAAGQQIDNSFSGFVTDGGTGSAVHLPARSRRTTHARAGKRQALGSLRRTRHHQLRRPDSRAELRGRPLRDPEGRRVLDLRRRRHCRGGQRHHPAAHRGAPGQLPGLGPPPWLPGGCRRRRDLGHGRRHLVLQRLGELLEDPGDDEERPRLVPMRRPTPPYRPGRRRRDRQHQPGDRRAPVLRFRPWVRGLALRLGPLRTEPGDTTSGQPLFRSRPQRLWHPLLHENSRPRQRPRGRRPDLRQRRRLLPRRARPGRLPACTGHRTLLRDFLRGPGLRDRRPQRQRVLRVLLQPPLVRQFVRLPPVLPVRAEDQPHQPVRRVRAARRLRRVRGPARPAELRVARSIQRSGRRPHQPVRRPHRRPHGVVELRRPHWLQLVRRYLREPAVPGRPGAGIAQRDPRRETATWSARTTPFPAAYRRTCSPRMPCCTAGCPRTC